MHRVEDAPRCQWPGGELAVGLSPHRLGRRAFEKISDAKMPPELKMSPVEERIPQRVGHRFRPRLKLLAGRGGARDPILVHAVGPHCPPLVVVALQPRGMQVFEPPVGGDVLRAEVAVVVDDRTAVGYPVEEVRCDVVRQQEGVVAEAHRHATVSRGRRGSRAGA